MKVEQGEVEPEVAPEEITSGWSARQDDTLGGLVLTNYNGNETDIVIPSKLKISQLENKDEFVSSQADSKLAGFNLSQYESEQAIDVVGIEGNVANQLPCIINMQNMTMPKVTSLYIPASIKQIGPAAFAMLGIQNFDKMVAGTANVPECGEVKVVFAQNSQLKTIDMGGFAYSGLIDFKIPNSVTTIGQSAFYGSQLLQSVKIGDSVTEIGMGAFASCKILQSVTLGKEVQTIGESAFDNCRKLVEISNFSSHITLSLEDEYGANGNIAYFAKHIRTSLKAPTYWYADSNKNGWYEKDSTKEYYLVRYNTKKQTEITLPQTTPNGSNYKINLYALADSDITKVTISSGVTEVGQYAFQTCDSLQTVIIENGLKTIGLGAFNGCNSLQSIIIPDTVTEIQEAAFMSSGLQSVVIGSGVKTLGKDAFNCGSLQTVYYHGTIDQKNSTLTAIENGNTALTGSKFYYYNADTETTEMGDYWYYDNYNDIVTFKVSATTLSGWSARQDDTLGGLVLTSYNGSETDIVIPKELKLSQLETLVESTQASSKLGGLNLSQYETEESIPVVGVEGNITQMEVLFTNHSSITSVFVPNTIKYIGECAFAFTACTNASDILFNGAKPTYTANGCTITFEDNSQLTQVGAGAFAFSGFSHIDLPSGVQSLPAVYFNGSYFGTFYMSNLQSITIPDTVTTIEKMAFYGCSYLETVNYNATSLQDVQPSDYLFSSSGINGDGITFNIGNNVTKIPAYFLYPDTNAPVTNIKAIIFEDNSQCTSIGMMAFALMGCQNPADVGIENDDAYPILTEVTVDFGENSNLTEIGMFAFGFSGIKHIEITENVTTIGLGAFILDTLLETINFNSTSMEDATSSNSAFAGTGFDGKGITLTFGDKVTHVPAGCVSTAGSPLYLTSINFNKVETIGAGFDYNLFLTSVTIPSTVKSIADGTFSRCYKLIEVTNLSSHITLTLGGTDNGNIAEYAKHIRTSTSDPIYLSKDSDGYSWYEDNTKSEYYLVDYVNIQGNEITLPNTTPNGNNYGIYNYAFETNAQKVIIPNTVTSIGQYAFDSSLQILVLGNGVTEIADYAFSSCESLKYVYYHGTQAQKEATLTNIGTNNSYLTNATWYFYNEHADETTEGNNWYYDGNGDIVEYPPVNLVTEIGWSAMYVEEGGLSGLVLTNYNGTKTEIVMPTKLKVSQLENSSDFDASLQDTEYEVIGIVGDTENFASPFNNYKEITSVYVSSSIIIIGPLGLGLLGLQNFDEVLGGEGQVSPVFNKVEITFAEDSPLMVTYEYAFAGSGIENIFMPNTIIGILDNSFFMCSNLQAVYYNGTIQDYANNIEYIATDISEILYIHTTDTSTKLAGKYWYYDGEEIKTLVVEGNKYEAKFNSDNTGLIITKYNGSETNLTLPSKLTIGALDNASSFDSTYYNTELNVVGVGSEGSSAIFSTTIQSVILPNTLTSIGQYTFFNCSQLASITIPQNVVTIGNYAFYGCSRLLSLTIPENVTSIGTYAFYNTTALETINFNAINCDDLTSTNRVFTNAGKLGNGLTVNFGDKATKAPAYLFVPDRYDNSCSPKITVLNLNKVETIGSYAFSGVNIKTLTIPESVTSIGDCAFYNTKALETINFNATNCADLIAYNNVFSSEGKDIEVTVNFGDEVKNVPANLFYTAWPSNVKRLNLNKIETIGKYAFARAKITTLTIPDNVITIGDYAFAYLEKLTQVTLGSSLKTIGSYAFYDCNSLTTLTIPSTVNTIGSDAFYAYRLIEITNLSSASFRGHNAIHIRTSESDPTYLKTVGDYIWYDDNTNQEFYLVNYTGSQTVLTLPSTTPSGNNYKLRSTFINNENITQVTIPNSVTQIDAWAFYHTTNLTTVNIPNSVTRIGYSAFNNSGITSIVLPENLKTIDRTAFYGCDELNKVIIPDSVTSIGEQAFSYCNSANYIVLGTGVKSLNSNVIIYSDINEICYHGTEEYKNANLAITGTHQEIFNAFWWYYNENTNETTPGNYWYYGANQEIIRFTVGPMWEAKLNDTSDGLIITRCFVGDTNVTIPSSIKISELTNASDFAAELQDQTFNVVGIEGTSAKTVFLKSLTNITLPNTITTIGQYAFARCTNLTSITIPENVTSIGIRAFMSTYALTEINFNAINCADLAFDNFVFHCSGKNTSGIKLTIGNNVTKIPAYLFYPTNSSGAYPRIKSVIIGSGVTSIGQNAFASCNDIRNVYYCGTLAEKTAKLTINSNGGYYITGGNTTWYYYNTDTNTTVTGKYWYYDQSGNIVTFTK